MKNKQAKPSYYVNIYKYTYITYYNEFIDFFFCVGPGKPLLKSLV